MQRSLDGIDRSWMIACKSDSILSPAKCSTKRFALVSEVKSLDMGLACAAPAFLPLPLPFISNLLVTVFVFQKSHFTLAVVEML